MADQLNMGGLSLSESQHAPNGVGAGRSTYIPPHLRGVQSQQQPGPAPPRLENRAPPAAANGIGASTWAANNGPT
jgi:ATP-dependent RNA helicase DDX3X